MWPLLEKCLLEILLVKRILLWYKLGPNIVCWYLYKNHLKHRCKKRENKKVNMEIVTNKLRREFTWIRSFGRSKSKGHADFRIPAPGVSNMFGLFNTPSFWHFLIQLNKVNMLYMESTNLQNIRDYVSIWKY